MNNNLSFFDGVIKPVLAIIAFLITIGMFLSAKGATIDSNMEYKENILPNLSNPVSTNSIVQGPSSIKSLEDKISRLESVINQDNNLRKLYHGGIPTYIYETNLTERTIQRVDKYPDGYIHIEKAQLKKILTAEDLAQREVARKNIKIDRINSLKQRIDTLSKSTNAVDAAKLAHCKRLLERLERASTTNYVDIVVKPKTKE